MHADNSHEAVLALSNTIDQDNPEASLGTSIKRIMNADPTIKHLRITSQCITDMEYMSNYCNYFGGNSESEDEEDDESDPNHVNVTRFFRELDMSGDREDDTAKIGTWIARCSRINTVEIKVEDTSSANEHQHTILDDDELSGFFSEISGSHSISTLHFDGCTFDHYSLENAGAIMDITNLKNIQFSKCFFKAGGADIFAQAEQICDNLEHVSFDRCIFDTEEDHNVFLYITTMEHLETLNVVRCSISAKAMKMIIRDIKDHHGVNVEIQN